MEEGYDFREMGRQTVRRMCDEGEEVSISCSLPHTPVPELSAQRESALRKCWKAGRSVEHTKADEQHCWAVNSHSLKLHGFSGFHDIITSFTE